MQRGAASTAGHKLHHALTSNAADCRKCSFWWPDGRVQALPPAGAAGAAKGGLKKVLGSSPWAKGGTLPRSAWGVRDPLCSHTSKLGTCLWCPWLPPKPSKAAEMQKCEGSLHGIEGGFGPAAQERRCGREAGWRIGTTWDEQASGLRWGEEKAGVSEQPFAGVMQSCLRKG